MKYFLQFAVMVGDVALLTIIWFAIYASSWDLFVLLLSGACLVKWWRIGGLEALRPSVMRQFMRNAKEIGL